MTSRKHLGWLPLRSLGVAMAVLSLATPHALYSQSSSVPRPEGSKDAGAYGQLTGDGPRNLTIYHSNDRRPYFLIPASRKEVASGVGSISDVERREIPAQGMCSAFLVGKDLVITGAACVSQNDAHRKVVRFQDWETPDVPGQIVSYNIGEVLWWDDELWFALLRVERGLDGELPGDRFRILKLEDRPAKLGEEVYVLGVPARGFLLYGECNVVAEQYRHGSGRLTVGVDCDSEAGYAGAPVLSWDRDRVLGIFWGGQTGFKIITQPGRTLHEFVTPAWKVASILRKLPSFSPLRSRPQKKASRAKKPS